MVTDGPNVMAAEGKQGGRLAGRGHELDFQAIRLIDFDHGAYVTTTESVVSQIPIKNDRLKNLEGHGVASGYAVTNRGKSSPARTTQTLATTAV